MHARLALRRGRDARLRLQLRRGRQVRVPEAEQQHDAVVAVAAGAHLGFGRVAASDREAPTLFARWMRGGAKRRTKKCKVGAGFPGLPRSAIPAVI
jgi:hypothetical protein